MASWPEEWWPITAEENPAEKVSLCGVYRVRATDARNAPTEIARACAKDSDGIVYIGQGILRDRIGALLDRNGHAGTHPFLETAKYYKLDRICARKCLELQWYESDTPKHEEQLLLAEYKKRFGDLPPGNLKLGG